MDQLEFRACQEGYGERLNDIRETNALLACWIVNNLPIPFVKNRKPIQPKQLLGKSDPAPSFGSPEELRNYMKKRQRGGE